MKFHYFLYMGGKYQNYYVGNIIIYVCMMISKTQNYVLKTFLTQHIDRYLVPGTI
jgi:hypothetical protein